MGVMDTEELDRLAGVSIGRWDNPEPECMQFECLACGFTFDDDAIEWDDDAKDVCQYCHSGELRKLGGTA